MGGGHHGGVGLLNHAGLHHTRLMLVLCCQRGLWGHVMGRRGVQRGRRPATATSSRREGIGVGTLLGPVCASLILQEKIGVHMGMKDGGIANRSVEGREGGLTTN